MSRVDIGNYLGLTVETVSRVFSRMQKMDILSVDNKEIEILDLQGVRTIANVALTISNTSLWFILIQINTISTEQTKIDRLAKLQPKRGNCN